MNESKQAIDTKKALIKILITLLIYIAVFMVIAITDKSTPSSAYMTPTYLYILLGIPAFSLFYGFYSCKLLRMVIVPNMLFLFAQIVLSICMVIFTMQIGYAAPLCAFSIPVSLISGTVTKIILMAVDKTKKSEPESETQESA